MSSPDVPTEQPPTNQPAPGTPPTPTTQQTPVQRDPAQQDPAHQDPVQQSAPAHHAAARQAVEPRPVPPAQPPAPRPVRREASPNSPFMRGMGAGLGVMIGAGIVLMALTLLSLLGTLLIGQLNRDAINTTSHVWGPANASNTMLALNVSGVIEGTGGTNLFGLATYGYELADQLDELDADDYAGVVLLMDTPGGSIYGSRAIGEAIERYQERTGKSVVAYVQSMSASGGMFAMAPADLIIADHGTMVGSIGVIMGPLTRYRDVTGLTGTLLESGVTTEGGITYEYITAGRDKDFGNPFRDMTDEEREVYTNGVVREYEQFVGYVAEHRAIPEQTIVDELGAHMFDPQTAVQVGLVDEVLGRSEGFRAAARANGVDENDTKIVTPAMPAAWSQLLGVEARVPGHNVPLDPASGAIPTSQLCVGPPVVLAYSGDFTSVCG